MFKVIIRMYIYFAQIFDLQMNEAHFWYKPTVVHGCVQAKYGIFAVGVITNFLPSSHFQVCHTHQLPLLDIYFIVANL